MKKTFLIALALASASSCKAQDQSNSIKPNHPYTKIEIPYDHNGCSFQGSPIDYCDEKHLNAIDEAIKNQRPNFNKKYILLTIQERKNYYQSTLVAIDSNTGIVYPIPIDFYSGYANKKGGANDFGKLTYSLESNKVCIEGSIFVYRAEEDGTFCFNLQGDRFTGHQTTYMDEGR